MISGCTSTGQNSCAVNVLLYGGFGSGCDSQGASFELNTPKDGMALVYVYRPKAFYQKNAWPDLYINNIEYGQLRNGGFLKIETDPGTQLIEARQTNILTSWQISDLSISADCPADQVCFVRVLAEMQDVYIVGSVGGATGKGHISIVPESQALQEIATLKEIKILTSQASGTP